MGLLKVGQPLSWEDAAEYREYVRDHGLEQFLITWDRVKNVFGDQLLYGDEVEYHIVKFDHENRTVKLSLRAPEILKSLQDLEEQTLQRAEGVTWHPEYGRWMVEATPREPYTGYCADLGRVERNLRLRRRRLLYALAADEAALSLPAFPRMGVGAFAAAAAPAPAAPPPPPGGGGPGPVANSAAFPDAAINPKRKEKKREKKKKKKGRNVDIRVPLFRDERTPEFLPEAARGAAAAAAGAAAAAAGARPHVHMDAMGFGMGMCCLQVTFQARQASGANESRFMYDQLATLAPLMLALTAATPILKGRLVDTDVRWAAIAASVDDRTPAEAGEEEEEGGDTAAAAAARPDMAGRGARRRLHKSRYDSVSNYIFQCPRHPPGARSLEKYCDVPAPADPEHVARLMARGLDAALAQHIAHLFTRDPLTAAGPFLLPLTLQGAVAEVDDERSTEHFENVQSTNWQTVRWKPPPPREGPNAPHIGWRVEFRSMEVQLTDFENAAFTVFVVLVTRVILAFDLNLYLPLSKVDENMRRAHARGAVTGERFFVRKHMAPPPQPGGGGGGGGGGEEEEEEEEPRSACAAIPAAAAADDDGCEEMSMREILEGKDCYFPGLIPLCQAYLDHIGCDRDTRGKVGALWTLIALRGSCQTARPRGLGAPCRVATRKPRRDSVVGEGVAYDLLRRCRDVAEGRAPAPELLGAAEVRP
ncbi:unnamed protein product, partial [Heterosigma akashiwo]